MKILYLSSNFPEKRKGDSIYTDLADCLSERGHYIEVFTCNGVKTTIREEERGYSVFHVASPNYYTSNLVKKGLAFFKMPRYMKAAIKKYASDSFDLILFEAPPTSFSSVCNWASKHFNAPIFLMQKDFFPENSKDLDMIKERSIIYKVFRRIERKCFYISDYIGVMSPKNMSFLLENNKDVSPFKISLFFNTINPCTNVNLCNSNLEKINSLKDSFVVGAIGNFGKPQKVNLIIDSAKELEADNIYFVLAGRGSELKQIETAIKKYQINNIILFKNPNRNLSDLLTSFCKVGLITIDDRFTIPNFPSRSLSYMKFGVPIVACTDSSTDFGYYITDVYKCGLWSNSKTHNEMCEQIKFLKENETIRNELGNNGKTFVNNFLSSCTSAEQLEKIVIENKDFTFKLIKTSSISKQLASIHKECFPNNFLTSLGTHFLEEFYKRNIKNKKCGVFGAFLNNKLVGFLSYSLNNASVAKEVVFRHPISIGIPLFFKYIFSKKIRKSLSAALKNNIVLDRMIYISSIAVSPKYQGKGIGTHLLTAIKKSYSNNSYGFFVLTDATDNDGANAFYIKNKFTIKDIIERTDGRLLNLYIFKEKSCLAEEQ